MLLASVADNEDDDEDDDNNGELSRSDKSELPLFDRGLLPPRTLLLLLEEVLLPRRFEEDGDRSTA